MEDNEPRLGAVRPSQFANCLLVKPELGRGRRTVYDLPSIRDPNTIYGRPTPHEHVPICSEWVTHNPSPTKGPSRDFVAMNKDAITHRAFSAHDMAEHRKDHTKFQKTPDIRKSKLAPLPSDVDPSVTYGRKTVPGLDLDLLLSHHYQAEWLDNMMARNAKEDEAALRKKLEARKNLLQHTKASMGHGNRSEGELSPKAPFKLKRFQNATPKVDDRRSRSVSDVLRMQPLPDVRSPTNEYRYSPKSPVLDA